MTLCGRVGVKHEPQAHRLAEAAREVWRGEQVLVLQRLASLPFAKTDFSSKGGWKTDKQNAPAHTYTPHTHTTYTCLHRTHRPLTPDTHVQAAQKARPFQLADAVEFLCSAPAVQ